MISPASARGKLYGSLKDLRLLWEDTQQIWDDPVSRDFDQKVFQPLAGESQAAIRGMDGLAQVLQQMQNECQ